MGNGIFHVANFYFTKHKLLAYNTGYGCTLCVLATVSDEKLFKSGCGLKGRGDNHPSHPPGSAPAVLGEIACMHRACIL